VVGRGGLLRPLEGGTYRVSAGMLEDARGNRQGSHASNLGCALAQALAEDATRARALVDGVSLPPEIGTGEPNELPVVPAFVVDPVSTDEFEALARLSGLKEISRKSLSHALSIHATAREVSRELGLAQDRSRLVVAHLGGGISICPVLAGRIIDANNANSGGPFSPTRAGGLPTQELLDLAFSGKFTQQALRHMTLKSGGLQSYLGTDDAVEVERRIAAGDEEARTVFEAMAYQISKEIGAMATVLDGDVHRIVLTGGLSASQTLVDWIRKRVSFIAPVEVRTTVEEMTALALGAIRVLTGEEEIKEY
jgi:butyrate kinase